MSNPYSSTIQAMIDTLVDLDGQITDALQGMNDMQSEILQLKSENERLKNAALRGVMNGKTNPT